MIDFSKVQPSISLTADYILKQISDSSVFLYYFGRFELGKAYNSFFRTDRNPSTTFYMSQSGALLYHDFSTGESLNCFKFVMKLYNCNFNDALKQIAADFGLINAQTSKVSRRLLEDAKELENSVKSETLIQFIPDKWNSHNLKFWRLYEITQEELEENEVYPVKHLILNKIIVKNLSGASRYAYPLKWEGGEGVKIYSPHETNMKWLSSIPLSRPFGIDKLPYESNVVIISKGVKDAILLKRLFSDVIVTQNESEASLTKETIELLTRKYDQRIIIWDADIAGVNACSKFNKKGFGYFNTPKEDYIKYGIKDCADFVKYFGMAALEDLLKLKNLL